MIDKETILGIVIGAMMVTTFYFGGIKAIIGFCLGVAICYLVMVRFKPLLDFVLEYFYKQGGNNE
jgi:ABC-type lipoprotein release transport system permease subunit